MKKKTINKLSSKKLIASTVSAAVIVSPLAGAIPAEAGESFHDVAKDAFYNNAVQELVQKGVISGYPDGTFKPNNAVTRAEFSAFLVKMLGLDTNTTTNPNFPDVHTNAWYYNSVATLAGLGLVGGYEDGTFKPNKTITRAEIAALLTRVCGLTADSTSLLPFTDVPKNSWYKDVVAALYQSKLVAGKTSTTFAPNDKATRAEAAVFLHRADSVGLLPKPVTTKIEAVTNDAVTIDGVSYQIADNLKGIFNEANSSSLKDAKITFVSSEQKITKVLSLEIAASGQAVKANEEEFKNNIVLDGNNTTIEGKLIISGNYVTIKNLKIAGNLEIAKGLQNDFYSENVTVSGKTVINGGDDNTVVFVDANLNSVEINKKDVRVEPKGKTTIKEVIVTSTVNITATDGVVIPKLTVKDGAEKVDLNVKVENVIVDSAKELSLYGSNIGKLQLVKSTKISLAAGTVINNLVLPKDVKAKDIIKNFEDVKKGIANINGEKNPDAGATVGGGGTVVSSDLVISDNYGTATTETISKNIVINASKDITLKNIVMAAGKKITIEGTGKVTLYNVTVGELTTKNDTNFREIVAKGTTTIGSTNIKSGASLTVDETLIGALSNTRSASYFSLLATAAQKPSFGAIELTPPAGAKIALRGDFGSSTISVKSAGEVTLEIAGNTRITEIKLEAEVVLAGDGLVDILNYIKPVGDAKIEFSSDVPAEVKNNPLSVLMIGSSELTWSDIKGNNHEASFVTEALQLPASFNDGKGHTINVAWKAVSPDGTKTFSINSGVITADGKVVELIATLSYGGKTIDKAFVLYVDTVQGTNEAPYIQTISFADVVSVVDQNNNIISADLSKVNTSTILNAKIGVSEDSTLKLTVDGLAEFDGINLQQGFNTIETEDLFANVTFKTLGTNVDFSELYDAIETSEIDKSAIIDGVDFGVLLGELEKVSYNNIDQLYQSVDFAAVLELLQSDSVPSETKLALLDHVNLDVILDTIMADEETDIDDLLGLGSDFRTKLKSNLPQLSDEQINDLVFDVMGGNFEEIPREHQVAVYESINFELIFTTIAKLSDETKVAVYRAVDLQEIFEIITATEGTVKSGLYDIFLEGLPGMIAVIENTAVDRTAIIEAINLSNIYQATGSSEGLSLELFKFLAEMDGTPDNVITFKATLKDEKLSNEYTLNLTVPSQN